LVRASANRQRGSRTDRHVPSIFQGKNGNDLEELSRRFHAGTAPEKIRGAHLACIALAAYDGGVRCRPYPLRRIACRAGDTAPDLLDDPMPGRVSK
jgi:hypothetical protein